MTILFPSHLWQNRNVTRFYICGLRKITLRITKFISENVKSRKKSGVVIGLSGGLDSSVCLVLADKAPDKNRIMGLIMPERGFTPQIDIDNAFELTEKLKIRHKEIHFEGVKKPC